MATERMTRDQSRALTRARLIDAAAELFAEKGVNGASVEQIAERAGYSRGAFYGNFADKDDLVLALLEHRTRTEFDEVGAMNGDQEAFRAWHRGRAANVQAWLALRTELWLHALRDERLRAELADRELFARGAIAGGIDDALTRAGVRPPADLGFLALIAHALEDGLLIQRVINPEGVSDEVVLDAVDLLCRSWIALAQREG
ncbi:TetR/AcrR family transcriptional regulator [Umezawaea sp. Da 62-37]|uniref:TetR/AcrR family transcriptional regulator n=1 Tax=Umezawaea sp. Da 62-37 TaxID=3075927 RepID=UPI0028F7493A|nr:TetR/AcrR family transcriptional regulator [Umezawaea sp. Da 62-37]WNV84608.1 TetR/AcrR family transcriptional regulator [Umezawaea sp. Da 62-37]